MGERRRICYVTGTRAEFGLMRSTLEAIRQHPGLQLQLVVTGMHLWPTHGRTLDTIRGEGWPVDEVVAWPEGDLAAATGAAIGGIAVALRGLDPDVVLVCGDRVEAFAAASAALLGGRFVAHVHGGDRAQGQADDALRHAITKLAHLHFPATRESRDRILKLGEREDSVFLVGTPGLDGITTIAAPADEVEAFAGAPRHRFALLVQHPVSLDEAAEYETATSLASAILAAGVARVIVVRPNNDPGFAGINRAWDALGSDGRISVHADVPRRMFLGLMRDAAFLAGNSSSGIIEAASFGTPVIDYGPRQAGRQRSGNVRHAATPAALRGQVEHVWNSGEPQRWSGENVYGREGAGQRIANVLATADLDPGIQRKLITY